MREDCPPETLYGLLAWVYRLPAETLSLPREDFGTGVLAEYAALRQNPRAPEETKAVLERFELRLSGYAERLARFSDLCQGDASGFCITHGDAGGNCMYDEKMVHRGLGQRRAGPHRAGRVDFSPRNIDIDFSSKYLTACLRALIETENADARATLAQGMEEYLSGCWIDARMDAADDAAK